MSRVRSIVNGGTILPHRRISVAGEPLHEGTLLDLLAGWEPLGDPFPDVDETLPPLRDVAL